MRSPQVFNLHYLRSRGPAAPVARLIDELGKLPGIGPKTASRLAFHLIRTSRDEAIALSEAIADVREKIVFCSRCFNISETAICEICADPERADSICVVEEALDVVALERTGAISGRYHVLHGAISPIDGIGPDQLRIRELVGRVQSENPSEIILATNLDLPGDATATYLHRILAPSGVRITRPASGLPVGGDLEYADEQTLGRALQARRVL
jgi:recombination protein RecR